MGAKVDCFGPRFPQEGIVDWPDDAGGGRRSTVDGEGFVDGAEWADGLEHGFGEAAAIFGVEFVKIEAGGFPILVQAEREIERRLTLQPCDVGSRLRCAEIEVVAVKVETGGVFTGAKGEAGGIKLGTDEPGGPVVEDPGLDQAQQRLGWSRFVSVDSRGQIDPRPQTGRAPGEGEKGAAPDFAVGLDAKPGRSASTFDPRGKRRRI